MKWKCRKCGKEIEIDHDKSHKIEKHEKGAKCSTCDTFFEPPTCHEQPMYVAS
ncbi:hypothetical protein GQ472_00055 [archaeon]|nr:hypothetical protein [archaeon]